MKNQFILTKYLNKIILTSQLFSSQITSYQSQENDCPKGTYVYNKNILKDSDILEIINKDKRILCIVDDLSCKNYNKRLQICMDDQAILSAKKLLFKPKIKQKNKIINLNKITTCDINNTKCINDWLNKVNGWFFIVVQIIVSIAVIIRVLIA